jgi:hypothetical protein
MIHPEWTFPLSSSPLNSAHRQMTIRRTTENWVPKSSDDLVLFWNYVFILDYSLLMSQLRALQLSMNCTKMSAIIQGPFCSQMGVAVSVY